MEGSNEIKDALKLLRTNGYIVIKPTKEQEKDMDECVSCGSEHDCLECSCNICLMQN